VDYTDANVVVCMMVWPSDSPKNGSTEVIVQDDKTMTWKQVAGSDFYTWRMVLTWQADCVGDWCKF
jgi:hypothetical protein